MSPLGAKRVSWSIAVCACLSALGCGDTSPEQASSSRAALVNARIAGDDDYPSTVILWQEESGCSGTKVGPRHFLTAAHCVTSSSTGQLIADYLPGTALHVSASRVVTAPPPAAGKVVKTFVMPAWTAQPYQTGLDAPDVAVVEIDTDTPHIPAAVVDSSPVAASDPLAMLGYGCSAPSGSDFGTLRLGDTKAVAGRLSGISPAHLASSVVTIGPGEEASNPGMCSGDSGGPIFRRDSNWVVGVGALSMSSTNGGASDKNLYTRLDGSSSRRVNAFLSGTGISMAATVPTAVAYGTTAHAIPGIIQAEEFDFGGEGVGYSDTDATNNPDTFFRTEGVDLDESADVGGGYNVGGTQTGEWLAFTSQVAADGLYELELRYSAEAAGQIVHVEVDGSDVAGPITLPSTGGWQTFQTATKTGVALSAGKRSVRVVFATGGVNLNWLGFKKLPCEGSPTCDGHAGAGGQTAAGGGGQGNAGAPTQAGNGGAGGSSSSAGAVTDTGAAGSGGVVPGTGGVSVEPPQAATRASSCSFGAGRSRDGHRPAFALLAPALALVALRLRRRQVPSERNVLRA